MSAENPAGGPEPGWRSAIPARGASRQPSAAGARWRHTPQYSDTAKTGSMSSRVLSRFFSAVLAIGCVAVIVVFLLMPGCSVTRVAVFTVPQFEEPAFAPLDHAQQDRRHFEQRLPHLLGEPAPEQFHDDSWRDWLKSSRRADVLLVYISATTSHHLDRRCLVLTNSKPDEPDNWMPLDQLWTVLQNDIPKATLKLVFLDLARANPQWRGDGFGSDDFGDLSAKSQEIANLVIVTSAEAGERSWGGAELGRSAFLRAILEGLSGQANEHQDSMLDLREVLDYVVTHTDNWVSQNRNPAGQRPQLFVHPELPQQDWSKHRVLKLSRRKPPPKESAAVPADGEVKSEIAELWKAVDRLNPTRIWQRHPVHHRRLLFAVHHAERLWLAGDAAAAQEMVKVAKSLKAPSESSMADKSFVDVNLSASREVRMQRADIAPALPEQELERLLRKHSQDYQWPKISDAAVQEAVGLRAKADLAAWRIAQHTTRYRKLVQDLDHQRRQQEDRLFASPAQEPQVATPRGEWDNLLQWSDALADARVTRDELLAWLPQATDWAAQRMPLTGGGTAQRQSWIEEVAKILNSNEEFRPPGSRELAHLIHNSELSSDVQAELGLMDLFESARLLARELRKWETLGAPPSAEDGNPHVALRELADKARGMFEGFQKLLNDEAREIAAETPEPPQWNHWQRVSNALGYRGLAPDVRPKLWDKLREYDESLNGRTGPAKKPLPAAPADAVSRRNTDALWRALWAIQELSLGESADREHATIRSHWRDWQVIVQTKDESARHAKLTQLAADVKQSALQRRTSVAVSSGRKQPENLEEWRRYYWDLDLLARSLSGYDAHVLTGADHSAAWPRWMRIENALWQADRYGEDYYAGAEGPEPWYWRAAKACLDDAQTELARLPQRPGVLGAEHSRLLAQLAQRRNAALNLIGPEDKLLQFGSKTEIRFEGRLIRQGDVPEGRAAIQLRQEPEGLMQVKEPGQLTTIPAGDGEDFQFTLTRVLKPGADCNQVSLKPQLWFRGHQAKLANPVQVDPCPPKAWTVAMQQPSAKGSILVKGADRKSLMFVFDCSGSMGQPNRKNRFDAALEQLQQRVEALANNGAGTYVGLVPFGHRVLYQDGKYFYNPNWDPQPDNNDWKSLKGVLNDHELLVSPNKPLFAVAGQGNLTEWMGDMGGIKRLQKAGPWGQTPLLGALTRATNAMKDKSGLVVAITDGAANDFANEPGFKAVLEIRPNVDYCIIEYQLELANKVEEDNKKRFDALVEDVNKVRPGRIFVRKAPDNAPGNKQLTQELAAAIQERPYRVQGLGNVSHVTPEPAKLGEPVTGLPRGKYEITFPDFKVPAIVELEGDEQLVYRLDNGDRRLRHEPHPEKLTFKRLWPATPEPTDGNDPDSIGYYSAKRSSDRIEIVVALDHVVQPGQGNRPEFVRRPKAIQFRLEHPGSKQPLPFDCQVEKDRSVPAWRLTVNDIDLLKDVGMPRLDVSWRKERPTPSKLFDLDEYKTPGKPWNSGDGRMITVEAQTKTTGDKPEVLIQISGLLVAGDETIPLNSLPWVEIGRERLNKEFEPVEALSLKRDVYWQDGNILWTWQFGTEVFRDTPPTRIAVTLPNSEEALPEMATGLTIKSDDEQ